MKELNWWIKARNKLARIAAKYKTPYHDVAYVFAACCYNNTIKGARRNLYQYLSGKEIGHKTCVKEWINQWFINRAEHENVSELYRALMGDNSAVPLSNWLRAHYGLPILPGVGLMVCLVVHSNAGDMTPFAY